jgi:photosystem II stability/assembly factor-like uncharacterized protein
MRMSGLGAVTLALTAAVAAEAQSWRQVGPPGGTVISLGADPHDAGRLYLGTSDGHVFTSANEGAHWQLLSRIGAGQDDVITHIIVDSRDSKRLFASTWTLYTGGGGVYRSNDSGRTWQIVGLAHETVRALAQSPTHPKTWLAASLTGVYRSTDEGANWERITPAKDTDLKNFDSVAFDPRDDNVIYAGTYHLPWKTTDGGKNWSPISKGMTDDSDVMSIIIDPANSESVHATACSGIYRSTNGAQRWTKYKDIPFVVHCTQLIRQDPQHPETLYAGTTSGLWKTTSGAGRWKRVTPVDWVIHEIVIDPKNSQRVIIGTEREGVQISEDGGATFASANTGFHHQHILDVAMDRERPERELVVLTFDTKAFLATKDGGNTWVPLGPGLKRTDLKHVYASPIGWWASLNKGGLMKYEETSAKWVRTGLLASDFASLASSKDKKGAATNRSSGGSKAPQLLASQVNDLTFTSTAWYAATTAGVLVSRDRGISWNLAGKDEFVGQAAQSLDASTDGSHIWAIALRNLIYSADAGAHWDAKELAFAAAGNLRVHRLDDSNLLITSNSGLYVSKDAGCEWNRADIRDLQFQDAAGSGNALVVSLQRHGLLASFDGGKSWQRVNSPLAEGYFPVVRTRRDGAVVAASATEGLLAYEPDARSADGSLSGSATSGAQKPQH